MGLSTPTCKVWGPRATTWFSRINWRGSFLFVEANSLLQKMKFVREEVAKLLAQGYQEI